MLERDAIHAYLKSLSQYLSRLEKEDAQDVIREIESHIFDVIEQKEQSGEQVNVQQILDGFGSPRDLANQYVDHILIGTPPPSGFKAIQKIKRGVTIGLRYSMAFFGYGISALLGIIGLMKLVHPTEVGIWVTEQGNSLVITFSEYISADSTELFGWWLLPLSLVACVLVFILTRRVLVALKTTTY